MSQQAQRDEFIRRALTETGFCARRLLGYDYDLDDKGERSNAPHGGIRATGPHAEICAAVDSDDANVVILAPRGSYKSTVAQVRAIRQVLWKPESRVLYGMDVAAKAATKVHAMRDILANNELVKELFGDLRGNPWRSHSFNVRNAPEGRQEFSMQSFGVDKPATGGHYELVILDDMVNHLNCATPEGIAKVKACFRMVSPLLVNGGKLIVLGTRYADDDLYGWIMREMADVFRVCVFEAGVDVETRTDGTRTLVGKPTFDHLKLDRLNLEFTRMGGNYVDFASQYLNRIVSGTHQRFSRHHFRPAQWDPSVMDVYTGWLLTDTATSLREDACHSVIAYVLFGPTDDVYLADLRVGHMSTAEFADNFFDVLKTWTPRCFHYAELWESIALNTVWRAALEAHPKKGNLKLKPIGLSRHARDEKSKRMRIASLENRFHQGRFFVLNTVPRTFNDLTKVKVLWDPEAEAGEDNNRLPGGEMVEQFIHFPRHSRRDICDALAIIDESTPDGGRCVGFCTPKWKQLRRDISVKGGRRGWKPGTRAPTSRPTKRPPDDSGGWVKRLAANL